MANCPVCDRNNTNILPSSGRSKIECARCGTFILGQDVFEDLPYELQAEGEVQVNRAVLSHAIYKMPKKHSFPELGLDLIRSIIKSSDRPSHIDQLSNLLTWIVKKQKKYGAYIDDLSDDGIAAVGVQDRADLIFILEHAIDNGLVEGNVKPQAGGTYLINPFRLTFKGWSAYNEFINKAPLTKLAFMAMKFGDTDTDDIYHSYFKPAVKKTGFDLKRLDERQPAGSIDDQLRLEIRQAKFLIADLTHGNNGAYWEAGFAEGLGKPVIYTCRKDVFDNGLGTHFDTNHHLTVTWDPADIDKAVSLLKATIRATFPAEAILGD